MLADKKFPLFAKFLFLGARYFEEKADDDDDGVSLTITVGGHAIARRLK